MPNYFLPPPVCRQRRLPLCPPLDSTTLSPSGQME